MENNNFCIANTDGFEARRRLIKAKRNGRILLLVAFFLWLFFTLSVTFLCVFVFPG